MTYVDLRQIESILGQVVDEALSRAVDLAKTASWSNSADIDAAASAFYYAKNAERLRILVNHEAYCMDAAADAVNEG